MANDHTSVTSPLFSRLLKAAPLSYTVAVNVRANREKPMTDITSLLLQHRSIRKFTGESVPQERLEEWIRAGQAAATSSFIQACTVLQVSPGKKRDDIAHLAGDQRYISEAPVFLVFCADMYRHRLACEWHDSPMLNGYTEQLLTATIDVALFAQNVVAAAEAEGAGICYIGGIRTHIGKIDELLGLPDLVYPVFGLCIGYPDQDPEVKPRLPLSVVLKQDFYDTSQDEQTIRAYDQQVQSYYASRTGGTKAMKWTDQMAAKMKKESRPHMKGYLRQKGFLLR